MDVLLVDDEPLLCETLHDDLREAGLDVVPAPTAEAGLAAVAQDGPPPLVLVTDMDLGPGMDGLALAQEAQRRWPAVVVVVMTGNADHLARLPPPLCAACLLKPFPVPQLVAFVVRLLGRRGA